MRPKALAELLSTTIPNRLPVLITGSPGIGKTDIVSQAAEAAGADLIISHPVVADPTDAKGLPWLNAAKPDQATFLPFGEMAQALSATKPTVWFLDDLGQATPAVQASFMQLLLARRVNGHVIPDCVTFVAATNRRTDRAGVSGILEPVKSRFACIIELEPTLDDWCVWALQNDMPPELIAFLRFRPDLLNKFVATADLVNSPCPRTWAHAGKLIKLGFSPELEYAAIAGAVGEGAAAELIAFLRTYRSLPNLDGILLDPSKAIIPEGAAALYAVATGLAYKATVNNFQRVARYCERLVDAGHGEFSVLCVRDSTRRNAAIMSTPAFIGLATGDFGKLMGAQ